MSSETRLLSKSQRWKLISSPALLSKHANRMFFFTTIKHLINYNFLLICVCDFMITFEYGLRFYIAYLYCRLFSSSKIIHIVRRVWPLQEDFKKLVNYYIHNAPSTLHNSTTYTDIYIYIYRVTFF